MANTPAWFDEAYYLSSKLAQLRSKGLTQYQNIVDVKVALEAAGYTPFSHFQAMGLIERTSPNQYFNATEYLNAKAQQVNAKQGVTTWNADKIALAIYDAGMTIWEHFQKFGWKEGVNPSNAFDVNAYFESKLAAVQAKDPEGGWTLEKVKDAFEAAGLDPISHYVEYGKNEAGVTVSPAKDPVPSDDRTGGEVFTLTVGADNVVGTAGNDTINVINVNGAGTAATTAQSFDKVDGGAGTDTLNWYATTTENTAIAGTFSNIEVVNFYGANNITGGINAALIGGSQQIWLQSTGGSTSVTGLSGKTLGVAGKTAGTVTGDFGTATTAALALNAASDTAGTGNAAVDIAGVATSLAVSGAGKATLTDNAGGADTIKTLTVAATGATTLDVTGLGALTAIDGSASTSNTTLVGIAASATSIKTGAGNDNFTVTATSKAAVDSGAGNDVVTLSSAIAAGSTINLGAGNDKLLFATGGSVAVSTSTVIDGGDGIDSVSAQLITAGNAAQFKNFELLNLDSTTGLDLALLAANNTLTGLTISSVGTTAIYQNVSKALGLTVDLVGDNSGKTNTLQFKDVTGTDDSYSIKFAADNSAATSAPNAANVKAGTLVAAGIENFNIESGGAKAWNSITLGTDASAKTVTITGAANLDLAFATGFGSTTAPQTGVTSIDGSAATGALSIDLANVVPATAGLSVKTGAGNDTIIVSTTGGTITTGAGKDVVDVKATVAGSTSAPIITTITDFTVGQDKLKLKDQGTETFAATKVNVDTATALFGGTVNALDLAATADGSGNAAITWFQYDGDTYVVQDLSASTKFDANDIVVKLTGLVDLSGLAVTDFDFA